MFIRTYKEDKPILNLKDYIKRHDYFRIFNKSVSLCKCYHYCCHDYCKHSVYVEKPHLEEADQIDVNLDHINQNKRPPGRPKIASQ